MEKSREVRCFLCSPSLIKHSSLLIKSRRLFQRVVGQVPTIWSGCVCRIPFESFPGAAVGGFRGGAAAAACHCNLQLPQTRGAENQQQYCMAKVLQLEHFSRGFNDNTWVWGLYAKGGSGAHCRHRGRGRKLAFKCVCTQKMREIFE